MKVFYEQDLKDPPGQTIAAAAMGDGRRRLVRAIESGCSMLLGFGLQDSEVTSWLASSPSSSVQRSSSSSTPPPLPLPPVAVFLDSSPAAATVSRLPGGWSSEWADLNWFTRLLVNKVPSSAPAKAAGVHSTLKELLGRRNSDDFLFIFLVLINEFVRPVPEVSQTTKGFDLPSLYCMIKNCGTQVLDCVNNPTCKAGLDCLQACSFNDQVGHRSLLLHGDAVQTPSLTPCRSASTVAS